MNEQETGPDDQLLHSKVMTSFLQIAALVILVAFCIMIVGPFAGLVAWGIILAIAIYPLHRRLADNLGGSAKASATIITLVGLAFLLVPGWLVTASSVDSAQTMAADIKAGTFEVPPPDERVAEWPVIGERVYEIWSEGAEDVAEFARDYQPQLRAIGEWLAGAAGSLIIGLLHFVVSVIIAGVMLMYPDQGHELSRRVFDRISQGRGSHLTDLSVATVRSVTNGVLGVAAIQAGLAGVGFAVIGLPAPGILTLVVLITAIIQVPAIIIMLPLIIWVFSFATPVAATVFAVYAILVALSDNVLKPMLLGRGVDLPVLVVLIGAIGGMIEFGVIGLFLGAVILGLGYRIISDWIWRGDGAGEEPASPEPSRG